MPQHTANLATRISSRVVPRGKVVAWWLGGTGFIFKLPDGTRICVDPYLSNIVNNIFGIARGFPAPITPQELDAHVVVSTHTHEDHLDPGSIPQIAAAHPTTRFIMPPSATSRALGWGLSRQQVIAFSAGSEFTIDNVTLAHAPARHDAGVPGWETPDAMGLFIRVAGQAGNNPESGFTIYHTGDTEYDLRLRHLRTRKPDVAILCINGAGGNMNAHEAALLAWQLGAQTVIPMHHILWDRNIGGDEATLDPQLFADTYRKLGGSGRVVLPEIGAEIELN